MLEKIFESLLVKSRIVTILPVIFGLVGAFVLFFIASYDVLKVILYTYQYFFSAGIKIKETSLGGLATNLKTVC